MAVPYSPSVRFTIQKHQQIYSHQLTSSYIILILQAGLISGRTVSEMQHIIKAYASSTDKPKYYTNKAVSGSDITCCLVQLLQMSFREPDLMDSHIHCASSAVNNDVTVTWFAKGTRYLR